MTGMIKITPEELRTASEFLGKKLSDMSAEANDMKTRIDAIAVNWEGAAKSVFMEKFTEEMWPILEKNLPDLIAGIQNQLNSTATALEETDNELAKRIRG